jgi:aconitate hydratase
MPGKTLLGSDSHTPTCGGLGMIAIGAGGIDVAVAMGGGQFFLTAPEVIKIELSGALRKWVSAKDVILHVLSILSTKGNVNKILNTAGKVLALLCSGQGPITNMGSGNRCYHEPFPSMMYEKVLKAQGRETGWKEIKADSDASIPGLKIDLSKVVPMAALPHSTRKRGACKKIGWVESGPGRHRQLY